MQHTLTNSVIFKGIGLHSGEPVTMSISPALADEGIRFIRKDVDGKDNTIAARYDLVEQSQLCTRLKNADGVTVSTVEHVMAAFVGCGIDNATVILDGPEVPIMDGSSLPFVQKFQQIGVESLGVPRRAIRVLKPIEVMGDDGSFARFTPDTQPVFEFTIDFSSKLIGCQHMEFILGGHPDFANELADCPTFTTRDQIDQLRGMGLIKGGSIDNAVIYDEGENIIYGQNVDKRPENAAVRHKILDAIGDCGLMGAPIIGRFECVKGGHMLTNQLLRALMADVTAYETVTDSLGIAQPIVENQSSTPNLAYNA